MNRRDIVHAHLQIPHPLQKFPRHRNAYAD